MEDGSSPQAESETKQQFVKEDFTDLDTVTHKGYNIFRYNGTETKHKEISDLFDEWDDSHGDKCRNTSKRNIFHGSNNSGTYIFANCGSDKTLSNKESTIIKQFKPYSKEAIKLFKQAVELADVPVNWAESESLHWILKQESGGYVGKPNYTIRTKDGRLAANNPETWAEIHYELKHGTLKPGSRRAKSSATGLGQLLLRNVEEYYPSGVDGIGVPLEEAAGMLAYIKDRYGNPDVAKRLYGSKHEGY
jgi:hypothetical protein